MVIFPIIATLLALGCAVVVARDYLARPRPDKVVWTAAFVIFAAAAGAEVVGALAGWTPLLARTYYVLGATVVVGYLALGELYLLTRRTWADRAAGVMLLLSALAVALVARAPVTANVADKGWEALERGPALIVLAVGINALGTLILLAGLLYSAWRFKQRGIMRNRMLGCLLIAAGTLVVAGGGTLTRLGSHQYLYIAMAVGTALIFAGYLRARQPDTVLSEQRVAAPAPKSVPPIAQPQAALSQSLTVTFLRAAVGGQVLLPEELARKLGAREGDLIAVVETDEGLLVTTREAFASTLLDRVGASLAPTTADEPAPRSAARDEPAEVVNERPVLAAPLPTVSPKSA